MSRGVMRDIVILIAHNWHSARYWGRFLESNFEVAVRVFSSLEEAKGEVANTHLILAIVIDYNENLAEFHEEEVIRTAAHFVPKVLLMTGDRKYEKAAREARAQGFIPTGLYGDMTSRLNDLLREHSHLALIVKEKETQ